jgi:hypothetical protein
MLASTVKQLREGLAPQCMEEVPDQAIEAYAELLGLLRPITSKCLPSTCNKQDYEDAESDALLRGVKYIRNVTLRHRDIAFSWDKDEWKRRLYSRFHDGVLESAKYLLYPFNLPRPIRFSLKKYSDTIAIIRKYSSAFNVRTSVLYRAVVVHRCSIEKMQDCGACIFRRKTCPLLKISTKDLNALHSLVTRPRQSLSYYAEYYRTPYPIWVNLMETVKEFSVFPSEKQELPVTYDLDSALTLSRVSDRMQKEDPRLFDIYCQSFVDVDVTDMNESLSLRLPRGWLSKSIKDDFGVSSQELQNLLRKGDEILNEFRAYEGLPPIQRGFRTQSATA